MTAAAKLLANTATWEPSCAPPRTRPTPIRGYLSASAIFVVSWIALSFPWLTGELTIPYDAKAHFQAQIQFLANAIHTDQSPMWSPHVFVGTPHVADPQSLIFSPAYLLAWFDAVPSFRDLDIYVLLLLGLGGLAMLALCRDRGWHPAGGVVAAIVFAFGASAAWRIQHIGQVQSYAFFAFSLWLLVRTLDRSSIWYGLFAGLAAGAMIIEPDQVALLGCYTLAGIVVGHWWQEDWSLASIRRSILPLTAAAVGVIVIAAVPLVLTTLYANVSNRPSIELAEAAGGSLHPASLLTAVIGDLYGALDPKVDYWGPNSGNWPVEHMSLAQNMSQVYVGALPILLMLTIGLSRRLLLTREIRPAVIALGLLILYAIGSWTPVFQVFHTFLPGVAIFRRPADATFLIGAMAALIAGYLVHCWATGQMQHANRTTHAFDAAILITIFALAITIAAQEGQLAIAWTPILYALGWILASIALLATKPFLSASRPVLIIAAPAMLLTADWACNNGPNESTALPTANYEILKPNCRNETIRFLKERIRQYPGSQWRDRVELVGLGFEWPNAAMIHGFDHTLGYNPLRIGAVSQALGAGDGIADPEQRTFSPLFPSYRSMLADLLGLRFIASSVPIEQVDTKLKRGDLNLIARTTDAYIYENPRALPRVIFANDWRSADFTKMIADGRWPDFDPRQTVLLDANSQSSPPPPAARLSDQIMQEQGIYILRYENTIVEIEVESDRPGFVVLNDAWHPWWTAEVDGKPTPVLRANVLFRTARVPAGRHIVRFEFKPFMGAAVELGEKLFGPTEPTPAVAALAPPAQPERHEDIEEHPLTLGEWY